MRPVLYKVNEARDKAGLRPLKPSRSLRLSARWMVHRLAGRPLAHDARIHVDRRFMWVGEVLARGQSTPEQVVDAWMASPTHRAILMSSKARRLGGWHDAKTRTWVVHEGRLGVR